MAQQIRFLASGHSAAFGSFSPGDAATVSDDMARHFVNEACCAEYVTVIQPRVEDEPPKPAAKSAKTK